MTEQEIIELLIDNVKIKRNEKGEFVFTGVEIVAAEINDYVSRKIGDILIQYANDN